MIPSRSRDMSETENTIEVGSPLLPGDISVCRMAGVSKMLDAGTLDCRNCTHIIRNGTILKVVPKKEPQKTLVVDGATYQHCRYECATHFYYPETIWEINTAPPVSMPVILVKSAPEPAAASSPSKARR